MNYQYRPNPLDEFKKFLRSGSMLNRLIFINVGVWLLISVLSVFVFLFNLPDASFKAFIWEYLALPADFSTLVFRPWTLITYMFLHINFLHILFNMLWLYWFGRIFINYMTEKQLLSTYIWGGIAGGILYILAYNIFPVFSEALPMARALGASASVMAVVTAISFYVPNLYVHLLFLGRIRIVYLAIALFIIDFFMIRSSNAGGHIAHIGGAIWGFSYVYFMKKGRDIGKVISMDWKSLIKPFLKEKKTKAGNIYRGERPLSDEEYNKRKAKHQERIDRILDKISRSGYESLTKEEKDYLFKSRNKNN